MTVTNFLIGFVISTVLMIIGAVFYRHYMGEIESFIHTQRMRWEAFKEAVKDKIGL